MAGNTDTERETLADQLEAAWNDSRPDALHHGRWHEMTPQFQERMLAFASALRGSAPTTVPEPTEAMVEAGARADYEQVFEGVDKPDFNDLAPALRRVNIDSARRVLNAALAAEAEQQRTPLSPEAEAARKPLPPADLMDARQEVIHRDIGHSRAGRRSLPDAGPGAGPP